MKTILVCGGAGYIGSHMVAELNRHGFEVIVADSLVTGHKDSVKNAKLYVGDLRDRAFLDKLFTENKIDGIINFAAFSLVGESCTDPLKYYENNMGGAISLLGAMRDHGVNKIVFSSTAATYGEPEKQPIEECDRTFPTNPYGETKLSIEKLLKWCDKAYGIKYVTLRYFNACGADNKAGIGEDHNPESHLIPIVLQAASGKRSHIGIFGDDYPTADGTCVRDYIHVLDLVDAHYRALQYLHNGNDSDVFNLGVGDGYSVREIIDAACMVTGRNIPVKIESRRAGDPSTLVACNKKAREVLGWNPSHSDLETIIASAWKWHCDMPSGYNDK